jgi:hypothetical protein
MHTKLTFEARMATCSKQEPDLIFKWIASTISQSILTFRELLTEFLLVNPIILRLPFKKLVKAKLAVFLNKSQLNKQLTPINAGGPRNGICGYSNTQLPIPYIYVCVCIYIYIYIYIYAQFLKTWFT